MQDIYLHTYVTYMKSFSNDRYLIWSRHGYLLAGFGSLGLSVVSFFLCPFDHLVWVVG